MASLFASAFRTQARTALVASRARVAAAAPAAARSFSLASRHAHASAAPSFARALSTSRALSAEYGSFERTERPPNPPNKTLYIGNVPYAVQDAELEEFLSTFGPVKEIRMGLRPDGSAKGFAHVEFANQADAVKVFEAHRAEPLYVAGRTVRVDYAPQRTRVATEPYHKLYVYDFPHDEAALRGAFEGFESNILSVYMLKDKMGNPLGSGFIEFGGIPQATEALNELNGRNIDGTTLNVSYARPPKPRDTPRSHGGDWQGRSGAGGGFSRGGAGRGGGYSRGGRDSGF